MAGNRANLAQYVAKIVSYLRKDKAESNRQRDHDFCVVGKNFVSETQWSLTATQLRQRLLDLYAGNICCVRGKVK